jgi:hypothetical protein
LIGLGNIERPQIMMTGAPVIRILRAHPVEHLIKFREGGIAKLKILAYRYSRLRQLRRNVLIHQTVPHIAQNRERNDVVP